MRISQFAKDEVWKLNDGHSETLKFLNGKLGGFAASYI
jgi:hypothetical protein